MMIACMKGRLETVRWLYTHGANMDIMQPNNGGVTPMFFACQEGQFEIVQWLHTHGAATDVMRPTWTIPRRTVADKTVVMTPMDIACQKGHLNIVKHLIHHHNISLTLYMYKNVVHCQSFKHWYPRLSIHNKDQLRQAAIENVVHCQSFFALATIVSCINIEPYKVMNEETGRLVVPKSSILRFRRQHGGMLLRMIASYLCGGKRARHLWGLILSPYDVLSTGHMRGDHLHL